MPLVPDEEEDDDDEAPPPLVDGAPSRPPRYEFMTAGGRCDGLTAPPGGARALPLQEEA